MQFFKTKFLEEADEFLNTLDSRLVRKILYNIDLAEQTNDPRLFKKVHSEIWEFRTRYSGLQVRLFAFWDKRDKENTLVIATHGIIKKSGKIPTNELERAKKLRVKYLEQG